jgi:hypothetical protein
LPMARERATEPKGASPGVTVTQWHGRRLRPAGCHWH